MGSDSLLIERNRSSRACSLYHLSSSFSLTPSITSKALFKVSFKINKFKSFLIFLAYVSWSSTRLVFILPWYSTRSILELMVDNGWPILFDLIEGSEAYKSESSSICVLRFLWAVLYFFISSSYSMMSSRSLFAVLSYFPPFVSASSSCLQENIYSATCTAVWNFLVVDLLLYSLCLAAQFQI